MLPDAPTSTSDQLEVAATLRSTCRYFNDILKDDFANWYLHSRTFGLTEDDLRSFQRGLNRGLLRNLTELNFEGPFSDQYDAMVGVLAICAA
jgi:hypothetical protein